MNEQEYKSILLTCERAFNCLIDGLDHSLWRVIYTYLSEYYDYITVTKSDGKFRFTNAYTGNRLVVNKLKVKQKMMMLFLRKKFLNVQVKDDNIHSYLRHQFNNLHYYFILLIFGAHNIATTRLLNMLEHRDIYSNFSNLNRDDLLLMYDVIFFIQMMFQFHYNDRIAHDYYAMHMNLVLRDSKLNVSLDVNKKDNLLEFKDHLLSILNEYKINYLHYTSDFISIWYRCRTIYTFNKIQKHIENDKISDLDMYFKSCKSTNENCIYILKIDENVDLTSFLLKIDNFVYVFENVSEVFCMELFFNFDYKSKITCNKFKAIPIPSSIVNFMLKPNGFTFTCTPGSETDLKTISFIILIQHLITCNRKLDLPNANAITYETFYKALLDKYMNYNKFSKYLVSID